MRKIAVLFILFSIFSFAQEKAILKVMNEQKKAWNNGDIEGYMQGYWKSDSLMFIGSKGVTYGWETTFNNYKKGYSTKDKMGELSFTDVKVKKLGNKHALVVGKWHLQRDKNPVGGIYTLIFKKFKSEWKIISDHTQ